MNGFGYFRQRKEQGKHPQVGRSEACLRISEDTSAAKTQQLKGKWPDRKLLDKSKSRITQKASPVMVKI